MLKTNHRLSCSVRIYNLLDLKEAPSLITLDDENRVESCGFSSDGRLLAAAGISGSVYIYLTRLNMLASVWQPLGLIAVLTSLKEVTKTFDLHKTCNSLKSSLGYLV